MAARLFSPGPSLRGRGRAMPAAAGRARFARSRCAGNVTTTTREDAAIMAVTALPSLEDTGQSASFS
jgi:hypothetical protein